MRKTIIILSLFSIWVNMHAQELPIYNQYIVDPFIVNSAYAGSYDYAQLSANMYQQNVNLKGSPKTYLLSFQSPYQLSRSTKETYPQYMKKSNVGLGGILYNDINGPFDNIASRKGHSARLPHGLFHGEHKR